MKASEWVDRLKVSRGLPSDYAAAKMLGVTPAAITKLRARGTAFDDETALKLAKNLNIDPMFVLVDQSMERAKDAELRQGWGKVLERLGGVAAAVVLGVGLSASPAPARASINAPASVYYVKSRRRGFGAACLA